MRAFEVTASPAATVRNLFEAYCNAKAVPLSEEDLVKLLNDQAAASTPPVPGAAMGTPVEPTRRGRQPSA